MPRRSRRGSKGALGRLLADRHHRYGVLARFFDVAQTCTRTFTVQDATGVVGLGSTRCGS